MKGINAPQRPTAWLALSQHSATALCRILSHPSTEHMPSETRLRGRGYENSALSWAEGQLMRASSAEKPSSACASAGNTTSRGPSHAGGDQVRNDRQPQNSEGARPDRLTASARGCRRGDRVIGKMKRREFITLLAARQRRGRSRSGRT